MGAQPKYKLSFRITVLVLFAALMLALSAAVITVNYQKNRDTVIAAGDSLLDELTNNVFGHVQLLFEPLFAFTRTVVLVPGIDAPLSEAAHPITPFLFDAVRRQQEVVSAYVGFENGDFLQLYKLIGDEASRASLKAPAETAFALRIIRRDDAGHRTERWRFLDINQEPLAGYADPAVSYDPRVRPWFQAARASDDAVVTDFYAFFATHAIGVTVARRFEGANPGVFALDLTVSSLSGYLKAERTSALRPDSPGQIALIAPDGRVIAHSNTAAFDAFLARQQDGTMPRPADLGAGVLETINAAYHTNGQQEMRLAATDGEWIGRVSALPPPFAAGTLVAIAVPSGEFVGSLIAATKQGVLFSALVVLLFLPLVYLAANAVAAPLGKLTGEIDQLRRFETEPCRPVRTFIREIQNLADALARSKFMLRVFGKYVPRNLVQQFVDTGTEPVLGGERRRLTVYFSDVRDFTTISEELPPEELMLVTSEYLEGLVEIILQSRGTVDKFVGDQIMAYWNAPTLNPNHATDGCIAVLRSRDWSNRQNEIWEKAGRRVLYTRFAVHLGEAVVGNVGSSDRMDYTVVGNTINLGSRLEGLNKIYGTQVLISEPVASDVPGKFVMRPVDKVLPKGAVYPLTVYELMGADPKWREAPADILATDAQRAMCERWSAVYLTYLKRDWTKLEAELDSFLADYPDDPLAALYRARVRRFKDDPPTLGWDGVIRYSEK